MNKLKIAITGKMGSGKSSIARIITEIEKDVYITSYSSIIKKSIQQLDLKPTREILQATGDFFRQFDNDVWTNALLKEIKDKNEPIIIEGMRYSFEAEKLSRNGFKILKVVAREDLRKKRIELRDDIILDNEKWAIWQRHPTETFIDQIKVDFTINNDESFESIKESIRTILIKLKQIE